MMKEERERGKRKRKEKEERERGKRKRKEASMIFEILFTSFDFVL